MSIEQLDNDLTMADESVDVIQNDLIRLDSLNYNERSNLSTSIEQKLSQLDQSITKMNNSVKNIPGDQRDYYNEEITRIRASYTKMLSELRQKRQAMLNDPGYKQNQQLNQNLDTSNRVLNNLDEAIATGNDTLTTAQHTQNVLNEDRKLIENIDQNLDDIDMEADKGFTRAKRMLCRAVMNNILIWSVVVVLVALLGFSLYWKLRKQYDLSVTLVSSAPSELMEGGYQYTFKFGKSVGPISGTTCSIPKVTGRKTFEIEVSKTDGSVKYTGSYKTSKLTLDSDETVTINLNKEGYTITATMRLKKH